VIWEPFPRASCKDSWFWTDVEIRVLQFLLLSVWKFSRSSCKENEYVGANEKKNLPNRGWTRQMAKNNSISHISCDSELFVKLQLSLTHPVQHYGPHLRSSYSATPSRKRSHFALNSSLFPLFRRLWWWFVSCGSLPFPFRGILHVCLLQSIAAGGWEEMQPDSVRSREVLCADQTCKSGRTSVPVGSFREMSFPRLTDWWVCWRIRKLVVERKTMLHFGLEKAE
jgi:hypothetical protein